METFELTDFNLNDQIDLKELCGFFKIMRSDDRRLVLMMDAEYGMNDPDSPTPTRFVNTDAALGFVLDIGIRREKMLTYHDLYMGRQLVAPSQSSREVSQKDFDPKLLEKIDSAIHSNFHSGDMPKEIAAIRMNHLLNTYNDARLLFPNFYQDSYLSLMRILDAAVMAKRRFDFAASVASISPDINREIYEKIAAVGGLAPRLKIAKDLFDACFEKAKTWPCASKMAALDQYGQMVFSCFYSAYQYRSKFVHQGLPFPDIVKESLYLQDESGMAYLHPAMGTSYIKIFRPGGLEDGDTIDMHHVIDETDPDEMQRFQDNTYFQLIPTWHFVKRIVRVALTNKIESL